MDKKDKPQFISYEDRPWILGNNVCFGTLHPDCVKELTKCACTRRNKQCDHVAQVMALSLGGMGQPHPACLSCAQQALASLVGVYCQFCHDYTEANIPWSPIPFVYICFHCSSRKPTKDANGAYCIDSEESFVTYPSVPVKK